MAFPFVFLVTLLLFYSGVSLCLFRREKKRRRLQPPETIVALRGPGESCRKKVDQIWERITFTILSGVCATMATAGVPSLVLYFRPEANVWILVGSTFCLIAACGMFVVTLMVSVSPGASSLGAGSWPTASEADRRCGGRSDP